MKRVALFWSIVTCLGCAADNPAGSSSVPPAALAPAAAVTPAPAAPAPATPPPATPAGPAQNATCKESFRMVPLNFQKQSGVLPEVLKVRLERLVPLSDEVHVATFDPSENATPGRQRGPLQVRTARLGAERGSSVQLEVPIDCGVRLQVDFGCGADAPAGGGYDGGSYNSHILGMSACAAAPAPAPAATPAPEPTPTPAPTPAPEPTPAPAGTAATCPDLGVQAVDVGSGNGQLRLQVSTSAPSAREIGVVARPEESGSVLQTTVPPTGGLAALTGPAPQRWYEITISAFAADGRSCELKLRICF